MAERFELYVGGLELCNGFSELNDAGEQRKRFLEALELRRRAGRPATDLPERFLTNLERMPPATGNALGVDRLVMILTGQPSIRDVILFPTMKPEEGGG